VRARLILEHDTGEPLTGTVVAEVCEVLVESPGTLLPAEAVEVAYVERAFNVTAEDSYEGHPLRLYIKAADGGDTREP
jgi:hypothetical protein